MLQCEGKVDILLTEMKQSQKEKMHDPMYMRYSYSTH